MPPPHAHRPFDDAPRPGSVVAGKYRVHRVVGTGGMGVVMAAEHIELQQPVALKFLHPEMARRPDVVRRFLREGQAAARLRSEHVARVIDVARTDEGQPLLVMELLEGIDLGQRLRQGGPIPVADAALYVIQTCAAIGEAHGLGIVHRDLKPANLFLTRRPDGTPLVKVVDFGISKVTQVDGMASEVTLTTGEDVLGSPLYMAPEQIRTPHDVDGRADLWSLGAILHRLVSNKSAFGVEPSAGNPHPGPAAVLAAIIADAPAPLRSHAPHAPAALEAVVARCLTRDLAARYQTAAELADALRPFAPGAQSVHVPAGAAALAQAEISVPELFAAPPLIAELPGAAPPGEGTTIAGGSVSSVDFGSPGRRRLVSSLVAFAAIVLVATGIGASLLMSSGETTPGAAAPGRTVAGAPAGPQAGAERGLAPEDRPEGAPPAPPVPATVSAPEPSASAAPVSPPPAVLPVPPAPRARSAVDPLDGRL